MRLKISCLERAGSNPAAPTILSNIRKGIRAPNERAVYKSEISEKYVLLAYRYMGVVPTTLVSRISYVMGYLCLCDGNPAPVTVERKTRSFYGKYRYRIDVHIYSWLHTRYDQWSTEIDKTQCLVRNVYTGWDMHWITGTGGVPISMRIYCNAKYLKVLREMFDDIPYKITKCTLRQKTMYYGKFKFRQQIKHADVSKIFSAIPHYKNWRVDDRSISDQVYVYHSDENLFVANKLAGIGSRQFSDPY